MAQPLLSAVDRTDDVLNHQYLIKDEPDPVFGSQDSGALLVKSESEELSWSEDHGLSGDSGYYTSFNMSHNTTVSSYNDDDLGHDHLGMGQSDPGLGLDVGHEEIVTDSQPLSDTTNQVVNVWTLQKGLVKIERSNQPVVHVQKFMNSSSSSGLYRKAPVTIQPKPETMRHRSIQAQTVTQVVQPQKLKVGRSRKCHQVPRVDEYHPEIVKPSQELLAARRLLEEALITGNIVSQARYARLNRKLDRMRMELAPRSSVIQSFSQKPPAKRPRLDENVNVSRVLYQENKRFEGRKFTWKIGINGPHKSFNRLSVKKKSKNTQHLYNVVETSDESDENCRT